MNSECFLTGRWWGEPTTTVLPEIWSLALFFIQISYLYEMSTQSRLDSRTSWCQKIGGFTGFIDTLHIITLLNLWCPQHHYRTNTLAQEAKEITLPTLNICYNDPRSHPGMWGEKESCSGSFLWPYILTLLFLIIDWLHLWLMLWHLWHTVIVALLHLWLMFWHLWHQRVWHITSHAIFWSLTP